jgi:hypothetical protein
MHNDQPCKSLKLMKTPSTPPQGFALIIALALMGFIVLLLLSMSTMLKIETTSSRINVHHLQARQNALLALQIALGELQRHAGPDQRSTGRADLLANTDTEPQQWEGSAVTPGGGIVHHNHRWLTGVWGNRADANADPFLNDAALLALLTSGNESARYTVRSSSDDSANHGRIDQDASIVPGVHLNNTPFSTSEPIVQMIGSGSVGTDNFDAMVAAVTRPISNSGNGSPSGRFAYWIGDEGVKAAFSVIDPWSDQPLTADAARFRYRTAQRNAINLISLADGEPIGERYSSLDGNRINNTRTHGQFSLTLDLDAAAIRPLFHDLTPYSHGLLTDVRGGGLKTDLSTALVSPTNPTLNEPIWSIAPNLLGASYGADMLAMLATNTYDGKGPRWQVLGSYTQLANAVEGTGSNARISPQAPGAPLSLPGQTNEQTHMGVFPVIAGYQFFFGAEIQPQAGGHEIILRHAPVIILWNPYNVTLRNATYHFEQNFLENNGRFNSLALLARLTQTADANSEASAALAQAESPYFFRRRGSTSNSGPALNRSFRFEVESGDMAPGRAYIYTLPNDVETSDTLAENYVDGSIRLQRGWVPGGALARGVISRSGVFATPPPLPADSDERYRLRFWFGGGGDRDSDGRYFANIPLLGEPLPFRDPGNPWSSRGAVPAWDFLRMRLGSSGGPTLQVVGDNPLSFGGALPLPTDTNFNYNLGRSLPDQPRESAWIGTRILLKTTVLASGMQNAHLIPWLADYNPRATNSFRSAFELQGGGNAYYNANPSFSRMENNLRGSGPISDAITWSLNESGGHFPFGLDNDNPVIVFDIPRPGQPLTSIADLRHADLYRPLFTDNNEAAQSFHFQRRLAHNFHPAYVVAHGRADQRVGLERPFSRFPGRNFVTAVNAAPAAQPVFFDHGYLANQALWDGYFFSTLPASGPFNDSIQFPLPNGRIRLMTGTDAIDWASLGQPAEAAASLAIEGAFNVNSTSTEAWKALLGATLGTSVGSRDFISQAPMPRFAVPPEDTDVLDAGSLAELDPLAYRGYRSLSPVQIDRLAEALVAEIKARGPFVSLADFVNRALVDNPNTTADERQRSALEAAIAGAGINEGFSGSGPADFASPDSARSNRLEVWPRIVNPGGAADAIPFFNVKQRSDADDSTESATEVSLATASPGWFTQGDLLQVIGPVLSARSDTFIIRSYGEAVNPVTGRSEAHIWCEALVQRLPEYIDPEDPATLEGPSLRAVNQHFGRRFQILSVRWLSSEQI